MADSALSVSLSTLRNDVSWYLGKGREETPYDIGSWVRWTADDVRLFDAHIASGLRTFYNPPGHQWSFLRPHASRTLEAGVAEYDMPDDFGFLNGLVSCEWGNRRWFMTETSERNVMSMCVQTGVPGFYCIVPKEMPDETGQRWVMLVGPKPKMAAKLTIAYSRVPRTISVSRPFPYGGMMHGETIREACLAAAEADSDDSASVHRQLYEQRLAASIAYDNNLRAPDYLGYNGDRLSSVPSRRRMEIFVNGTDISSPAPPPSGSCDSNNWIVYE